MNHTPSLPFYTRIVFGLIWIIDALLGMQPGVVPVLLVVNLYQGVQGQPEFITAWLRFWYGLVSSSPALALNLLTVASFVIGVSLILGTCLRVTYLFGAGLSLFIWSITGFGGPYQPYTPDIGAPPLYAIVFLMLYWAGTESTRLSFDVELSRRLKWWSRISFTAKRSPSI